ncbi:C-Jun-amino-terminal kinase-interacting protein 1a [Denticeps clupeoides]|uniref:C-Jun-amino-terminal kinase-interacting protein 1a n=1 Tax=Denticeps clupeoides TaxID=299321 RepID=UPI0010A393CC|nr:C-Jun-amino-terminal kinase-interacting protein 1-like [Denticeps clupeoides]
MLLSLDMESNADADGWMEEQWEKWLTHDISLGEYDDEDLSEVTDIGGEQGAKQNRLIVDINGHMSTATNGSAGLPVRRRAVAELQSEMLHLDLIDAEEGGNSGEGDDDGDEREQNGLRRLGLVHVAPPVPQEVGGDAKTAAARQHPPSERAPVIAMDTYRPKRPTTLNLFPQVPRSQDTINNNSFGEKERKKKEKVSRSSSPHVTGELSSRRDRARQGQSDEVGKAELTSSTAHRAPVDKHKPTSAQPEDQPAARRVAGDRVQEDGSLEKAHYHTLHGTREMVRCPAHGGSSMGQTSCHSHNSQAEVPEEPGEDAHLSPTQPTNGDSRHSLSQSSDSNRMSLSSDSEAPPIGSHHHHQPKPSISEEEEEDSVCPPTPPRRTISLSEAFVREGTWRAIAEVDEEEEVGEEVGEEVVGKPPSLRPSVSCSDAQGLSYDAVKYTLVVDEHAKLELVSLKQCYQGYQDSDSDNNTVYESALEEEDEDSEESEQQAKGGLKREESSGLLTDSASNTNSDVPRSRKFRNVFTNGHASRLSGAESFGLFSCIINGEEQEQSHRAVFRFVPRHDDELELEADDPLLLKYQAEDLWCEAYNMRTGAHGIFPSFYAVKIAEETSSAKEKRTDWMDTFWVKFLGSVQVPYHKGNDVLCAAMQKIAKNRRVTMQFSPPSLCIVEINMRGVKIIVQDDCRNAERGDKCCHFFQLKNISFCGCHPKNTKYFGLITKHPAYQRFACHVFFSEDSSTALAESVGKAFQQFYKEHLEYSCPTEDIFLE